MNLKQYKWPFYIFTFFLVTFVAMVLKVKTQKNVPPVSDAILLVVATYLILYLVYKAISKLYGVLKKNHSVAQKVNLSIEEKERNKESVRGGGINRVSPKKKALQTVVMIVGTILFVYLVLGVVDDLLIGREPQIEPIDKNPIYSEQTGDLYRNTRYKFRIKFPEGWEQKAGDRVGVLWKASSGIHTINIAVQVLSEESKNENIDAVLEGIAEDFVSDAKEMWTDFKSNNTGVSKISNQKALWLDYTRNPTADPAVIQRVIQYYVINKNILYIITTGSSADEFNSAENTFKKSLSTFEFED